MTTTTTTTKKITIILSDAPSVRVAAEDWPVIAIARWFSGKHECQANEVAWIKVRAHADGRVLVYGSRDRGPGGMPAGYRGCQAGYLLAAPIVLGRDDEADRSAEIIRAIRRVDGVVSPTHVDLAAECIADLPARDID